MKYTFLVRLFYSVSLATLVLLLSACGGGGGGSDDTTSGGTTKFPQAFDFEEIMVSPLGGEYELANGINLSIPAGAVDQDTTISLRRVPPDDLNTILNSYGETEKTVLAGVQSSAAGVTFKQPITMSIPLEASLTSTALPLLMVVDPNNGIYAFGPSEPAANAPNSASSVVTGAVAIPGSLGSLGATYVQYDCDNNRVIIANITGLPEGERALAAAAIEHLREESDCIADPCRCCVVRVQEEAQDIVEVKAGADSEQSCYNASIKGTVQYLQCVDDNGVQLSESYELSENSVGAINYTPSKLEMESASGAVVNATIVDAKGDPLEEFKIVDVKSTHPEVASKGFIEVDQNRFQVLAHKPGHTDMSVEVQCKITSKDPLPVDVKLIPIVTDQDNLVVPEGESTSFHVHLGAPPPKDVSIIFLSVELTAGSDPDISITQTAADFDETNWNVDQQVTLAAAEDDDDFNGVATLLLNSESDLLDNRALPVSEVDNDLLQFVTSSGGIPVPEGGNGSFTVRLTNEPLDTVDVSVAHVFGDTDISIGSGASLSFNLFDWDIPQTVVLNAAEDDDDIINGVATIRVSDDAGQLSSVDVAATEVDNDTLEMTMTPGELCVERGQTANFSVIASTAVDFSQLQWESSDINVATVDQTGNVTAQAYGPAMIIAQAEGAQASAVVKVREHCFQIKPANSCLHAPIENVPILPTNLQQLEPNIDTALAGHTVSYTSSNEAVVTIDATGTMHAHAGGDALISASVDNVVTNYNYPDVMSVHVAGSLDEYQATPIQYSIFSNTVDPLVAYSWWKQTDPYALFLTDDRNIYTQGQIVAEVEAVGVSCGGFPTAPDNYTITDFNNVGEYVGYYNYINNNGASRRAAVYLDSDLCLFREMGIYPSEQPKAINDNGTTAIDITDSNGNDRVALATRSGSVTVPYAETARDLNNNGLLILDAHTPDPIFFDDICFDISALVDSNVGEDPSLLVDELVSPTACDHPVPMALNNSNIVVANYQWGQFEELLLGTVAFYTYPDGMYLYYDGVNYDIPLGSDVWALDVNDSQDVLASSPNGGFVAHVCPFTLESNACEWMSAADRQQIEGYEASEFSCDGLDNDCDGLVDENLTAPLTFKQQGVCASATQTCGGRQGWIDDYSSIPGYEFPEVSCDDLDNDCDGIKDEGCPPVVATQ